MSLKAFHIVFVVVSTLMCIGTGIWFTLGWNETGNQALLALAVASFLSVAVLVWYGFWVMKKLKGWSFL